jgi:cytochrome P450
MLTLSDVPVGFHEDPYPIYEALRREAPACRQPDGSVILSRYDDLLEVYRDTDRFISDKKAVFGPKFGAETPLFEHHTTSLVFNDPPLHTRVRAIMVGAMSPRALRAMSEPITALVERLLDNLAEMDAPDLVEDFASAIPVEVIGNMFDIPHDQRGPLRDWSLAILGALEPVLTPEQQEAGNRAVTEFVALLEQIVQDRRRKPGNPETDVLTRLIQGEGGDALSPTELYQNCIFILNAGHETTTNVIASGLALMDCRPAARAVLLKDPDVWPRAVDEVLRMESPNQFGNRLTTREVTFHGETLEPGTNIHLCIGAANRDAVAFPQPDVFDPSRRPNKHLAFGGGAHTCVGLTLARMEAQIALSRFLSRFPNYRLRSQSLRSERIRFRGFVSLPVDLGVGASQAAL